MSFTISYHRYIRRGWIVLLALIIGVPVYSWMVHTVWSDAWGSSFMTLKFLGQITGIIGAQLFAFSLILSSRVKFLERLFGGLDKLYSVHHKTGVIGFAFLAVHPLVLAFRFVPGSFEDAANFLSPLGNTMPITLGIFSFLGMLLLLGLTFYGIIFSYPTLKRAHSFFGFAFFLGFLHVFFIPSSLSTDTLLKVSLLGTAAIGLIGFTYRTLFGKWVVYRYHYMISSVKDLGGGMTEVTLVPEAERMQYLPGQFAVLSFPELSFLSSEEHPFTISSSGLHEELRFSIKALGDYTGKLSLLKEEMEALVEGPFGEFSYLYGKQRQIWVAGGIGVTPFVSMAEYILAQDMLSYTIDLFYSSRSDADGAYKELFAAVASKHPTFTFHFMPSDTKGFITGELLLAETRDLHARDVFVCGPPRMVSALSDQLLVLNFPVKSLRTERFALLK